MAFTDPKFNSNIRVLGNIFSNESAYQQPVLDIQTDNTLNPTPSKGDRYLLTDTGNLSAAFTGISGVGDNDIVEYDGSNFVVVWDASAQGSGAQVYDKDSSLYYEFNGTAWAQQSATVSTDSTIDGDGSSGSPLGIADTAVTPGAYGDAQTVGTFTVDQQGRLTAAGTATIDDNTKVPLSQKGAANGVAELDGNSKVPAAQLPAIAITDVVTVADITARDALTIGTGDGEIQEGDVAIVTDASADAEIASGTAAYIYDGSAWLRLQPGIELGNRSGAVTATVAHWTSSLTQVFTHNWATQDVQVEVYDATTGETILAFVTRASNTVSITLNQIPSNDLRVMLKEISASQTTITRADG